MLQIYSEDRESGESCCKYIVSTGRVGSHAANIQGGQGEWGVMLQIYSEDRESGESCCNYTVRTGRVGSHAANIQ